VRARSSSVNEHGAGAASARDRDSDSRRGSKALSFDAREGWRSDPVLRESARNVVRSALDPDA